MWVIHWGSVFRGRETRGGEGAKAGGPPRESGASSDTPGCGFKAFPPTQVCLTITASPFLSDLR